MNTLSIELRSLSGQNGVRSHVLPTVSFRLQLRGFLQAARAFTSSTRSLRFHALDFRELIDQRPPAAIQVAHDRFALGGEAEVGFALPICADPEISDELAVMGWNLRPSSRGVRTRLETLQPREKAYFACFPVGRIRSR
jgi:hypothetical protein